MFIDARKLPDNSVIETDIAIIGAGPAGITIAREFAGHKLNICLIESGDLELDPNVQALYTGESIGVDYPLKASRMRLFGGSSNHWGGYCRPLDEIDFEKRDWIPHSGWPITRQALTAYYDKAAELVEVFPAKFEDSNYWSEKTGEAMLPLATGRLELQFVHFSNPPTAFGRRYRNDLERAKNIRILLNANVTNIVPVESGKSVTQLDIKTMTGLNHKVKARTYILATGGLENARTLLLSRNFNPSGLGNEHDLVGRFFMEHPHMAGTFEVVIANIQRIPQIYRKTIITDNRPARVAYKPSSTFLRDKKLLNATFQFGVAGSYQAKGGNPHGDPQHAQTHLDMLRASRRFINEGSDIIDPKDPSLEGTWLGTGSSCEQVPNPDSRVMLSSQRDVLGLEKIQLNWKLTEQDRQSYIAHLHSLAAEFGALGLGRLILNIEKDSAWPAKVLGGNHHMGTTRMSDSPKSGVVDQHCKVHGLDNLYIAGSSVFPTSGTANPTLTIIALALRLADHLKEINK